MGVAGELGERSPRLRRGLHDAVLARLAGPSAASASARGERRDRPCDRRRGALRTLGSGDREAARARARGRRRRRGRARRRRERAQRRLSVLLPHPRRRQRPRPLRGRDAGARAARVGELRGHPLRARAARYRLRLSRRRGSRRRGRAARGPAPGRVRGAHASLRAHGRAARPRWRQGGDRLADVSRGRLAALGLCGRRPREALLGPRPGGRGPRRAHPRAHAGEAARGARARGGPRDPGRFAARAPGPAGDQRLPRAAPRDPAPGRPGLGLRPGHRAPEPGAARRDRLVERPGAWATWRTASTTRGRPPTAASSGAATTRSTTTAAASGPTSSSASAASPTSRGHFFAAFPQLEGVRFSHRWGGAIDTCSRFFAFHGTALGGRVAYTVGHTGLGVGASRFGATVALDLLAGRETEATRLRAIRSKPVPFPPEPLRWAAIELTRNRLAAADRRGGRRGLWLRALDRLGLGFDS